jgi:hypothetical protein
LEATHVKYFKFNISGSTFFVSPLHTQPAVSPLRCIFFVSFELDLHTCRFPQAGSSVANIELGRLNANTTSARGPRRYFQEVTTSSVNHLTVMLPAHHSQVLQLCSSTRKAMWERNLFTYCINSSLRFIRL